METVVRSRIDLDLKEKAAAILSECGLTWSTAIRIFAEQIVKTDGLPFEIKRVPNKHLLSAMQEANEIAARGEGRFSNTKDLVEHLKHGKG